MKKILACILAIVLLLGVLTAAAEQTAEGTGKYEKLSVGTITPFSGNFLSGALGNNISDQDVRRLIHGYQLVYWNSASGSYAVNSHLVTAAVRSMDGLSYTLALDENLTYSDGTPIRAQDYAFSLLLLGSPVLKEACGGQEDLSRIKGGKAYCDGTANAISGVTILSDYMFSIDIEEAYTPYFYELKMLEIAPLPISVIAPGCEVLDDGQGAYISGPFSADLLKETLSDPETGYISHPSVTCGPYTLQEYEGDHVLLKLNPNYVGNPDGTTPSIPQILLKVVESNQLIGSLASGSIDLAVRCDNKDQIQAGMTLAGNPAFGMNAYSRPGLVFISFCAENGLTSERQIRKGLIMCMNEQDMVDQYLGAFGTTVIGYYGIGQWMFQIANGTLHPEEGEEDAWADLTLDNIPRYDVDTHQAGFYFGEAGWNLDKNGNAYKDGAGTRYKKEGDELVPLKFKMIYPEESEAGQRMPFVFETFLNHAGAELELQALPMTELLQMYYGRKERDCDMILLGTNLGDVFDPSGDFDANGTNLFSGINDKELAALAVRMRQTEPGNAPEFCRRWLKYQERFMDNVDAIPLYSDAYLDFHIVELQNYAPSSSGSWTKAVTEAFLSDYVAEEETEEELGGEEFEGEGFEDLED